MKALPGTVIVCVLLVVIAVVGTWIRQARFVETELALTIEADFSRFGSFRPDGTVQRATRLLESLTICLDQNLQTDFSSPKLNTRVEVARSMAISNLVASLETYSGMHYGTNVQAWQDWLTAQSADGTRSREGGDGPGP
jgi:hypothetical protein